MGADGAKYETQALEPDIAMEMMKLHVQQNHAGPVRAGDGQQQVRSERIQRPKLVIKEGFMTDKAFNYFEHAWGEYKVLASITTAAKQHLSSCLGEEVSTLVYNRYGKTGYEGLDKAGLLEAARGLVVKTRNKLVTKLQLQKMSQGEEEPVQTFLGRMKPIARNCGFKLQCPSPTCAQSVDYTDEILLMQMIAGLADVDIKRKVLGQETKTLEATEKFIMAEESGKWSTLEIGSETEMTAGLSNDKKQQGQQTQKEKICSKCGHPPHGKDGTCPAAKEKCRKCDRIGHYGRVCRSKRDYKHEKEENNALMVEDLYYLQTRGVVETPEVVPPARVNLERGNTRSCHTWCSIGGWGDTLPGRGVLQT